MNTIEEIIYKYSPLEVMAVVGVVLFLAVMAVKAIVGIVRALMTDKYEYHG